MCMGGSQRRSDKRVPIKTYLSCDQYKTCGFNVNVADSAFYNVYMIGMLSDLLWEKVK